MDSTMRSNYLRHLELFMPLFMRSLEQRREPITVKTGRVPSQSYSALKGLIAIQSGLEPLTSVPTESEAKRSVNLLPVD